MPGPLDSGTWHGTSTKQAGAGRELLRRLRGINGSWLWANRMRLLVLLAAAAGALSLSGATSFRGYLPHACDPGDCTGACAVHPSCSQARADMSQPDHSASAASRTAEQKLAAELHVVDAQSTGGTEVSSHTITDAHTDTRAATRDGGGGSGADSDARTRHAELFKPDDPARNIITEAGAVKHGPREVLGPPTTNTSASSGGDGQAGSAGVAVATGARLVGMGEDKSMLPKILGGKGHPKQPERRHVEKYRTFKLLPTESLSYDDVAWCPAAREPPSKELVPFHPGFNSLLILGVQKAATTWLFNALTQHPSMHGAEFGYMRGPEWSKEVHYFDRWPLEPETVWMYADTFPPRKVKNAQKRAVHMLDKQNVQLSQSRRTVWRAARKIEHRSAFVDASPEYLLNPAVAPRIQHLLPLARFVVVLRDPVARDISAHFMHQQRACERRMNATAAAAAAAAAANATGAANATDGTGSSGVGANATSVNASDGNAAAACTPEPFDEVVERLTGSKPEGMPDACWRYGPLDDEAEESSGGEERKTWQECHQCTFTLFNSTHCANASTAEDRAALNGCDPPRMQLTDYSSYAAQLAWWLAFFPPEQFLILTTDDLRDPKRRLRTLNRVLDHALLPNAGRFTPAMVEAASGFSGNYSADAFTPSVLRGAALLRRRNARQDADLRDLLNTFWPEMGFQGFAPEV
eukprot:jgi/Ulvmu1/11704/UM008_0115.1